MACIKARRSEVCPDIEEERAEFRDADLVYKRLKRRKTSDILASTDPKESFAVMIYRWLIRRSLEEKQI